jgi:monofunctional biosynthetic peptidoglycan transglycosylase
LTLGDEQQGQPLPENPEVSQPSGPWRASLARRARDFWIGHGPRPPWIKRILAVVFVLFVPAPIVLLLLFRLVPVPFTPEMLIPLVKGEGVSNHWLARSEMAPALTRAVIASEDNDFCNHHGFDWKDIDKAIKEHEHGRRLRGASTISQETARTIFLFPVRSWVRKGVEAYLTVLMEFLWPKERILTAYLNLVDWGHGNFGAEAASQAYFHKSAGQLSEREAARLAVVLADPDVWRAAKPGPYVAARTNTILARMGEVTRDNLDWCVKPGTFWEDNDP